MAPGELEDLSALPLEERVSAVLERMSLEEKIAQMHGVQLAAIDQLFYTPENERLNIPSFRMVDGPRGLRAKSATAFPVGMARGATWNIELEEQVGKTIGLETAARGGNVLLAPTINLLRHPGWGRAQETYGEDSHHLAEMGIAFVRGAQQHVIASAKHFAANSIEDTRFEVSVNIDERSLREIYLPHFRRVVQEAKVGSIMSAYNRVNGTYCAENNLLLRQILKGDWGFDGFVESDWFLGTRSTEASAQAGLDIEMPSPIFYGSKLLYAVEDGRVDRGLIDDSVRRILRKKYEFELDEPAEISLDVIESPEHRTLAQTVAEQAIVLLKNEAILPLAKDDDLVVVGALADVANMGDEGSSAVTPSSATSPWKGISALSAQAELVASDTLSATDEERIAKAKTAVIIVGLTAANEGENIGDNGGDRDKLTLSAQQEKLIEQVASLNPRTVVILEGGSAITMPWLDKPAAVMMAWYPGMEGGHAIANLLFGEVNPSGRLPISFPTDEAQLPAFDHTSDEVSYGFFHGYRHLDQQDLKPLFPFGFGMSYTNYSYESIALDSAGFDEKGKLRVEVTLKNTGSRTGDEVVQLYVGLPNSRVMRAPRDLRAFARATLEPGERQTVQLHLQKRDLAYFDSQAKTWRIEAGDYRIEVGPHVGDLPLKGDLSLAAEDLSLAAE
jgi:beta-glucosidase